MNFSTNQVRHFYLLKRENVFASGTGFTGKDASNNSLDPATAQAGDYSLRKLWDTTNSSVTMDDKAFELMYQGKGGLTHSDIIRQKNIRKVNVTAAPDMDRPLCKYQIQFNTFSQETGEVARNFYLNFEFPGFASLTPEETFTKTVVFAADYSSASNTATNCKNAIDAAFSHEFAEFVTTSVSSGTITIEAVVPTRHNATAGLFEISGTDFVLSNFTQEIVKNNGITIRLVQPYAVEASSIAAGKWVNLTTANTNVIKNDAIIRDLEIFCMGDRGDNYRMKGWPNFVPTDYMITSDNDTSGKGYDVLDLHYYYQGEGTNDDKSEKVITLAIAHVDDVIGTGTADNPQTPSTSLAALNAIKTALLS